MQTWSVMFGDETIEEEVNAFGITGSIIKEEEWKRELGDGQVLNSVIILLNGGWKSRPICR